MIQEIIALTIVFLAAAYTIYSTVKTIRVKSSGSCGDTCSCSAKDEFRKKLKNNTKILAGNLRVNPLEN